MQCKSPQGLKIIFKDKQIKDNISYNTLAIQFKAKLVANFLSISYEFSNAKVRFYNI